MLEAPVVTCMKFSIEGTSESPSRKGVWGQQWGALVQTQEICRKLGKTNRRRAVKSLFLSYVFQIPSLPIQLESMDHCYSQITFSTVWNSLRRDLPKFNFLSTDQSSSDNLQILYLHFYDC